MKKLLILSSILIGCSNVNDKIVAKLNTLHKFEQGDCISNIDRNEVESWEKKDSISFFVEVVGKAKYKLRYLEPKSLLGISPSAGDHFRSIDSIFEKVNCDSFKEVK